MPVAKIVDGVPMYLGQATRLGREAIRRFASKNEEVRETLARYVRRLAATMRRIWPPSMRTPLPGGQLVWKGADELEAFGTETTSFVGCAGEALRHCWRLFETTRHLNEVRARCSSSNDPQGQGCIPFWRWGRAFDVQQLTSDNPYLSRPTLPDGSQELAELVATYVQDSLAEKPPGLPVRLGASKTGVAPPLIR